MKTVFESNISYRPTYVLLIITNLLEISYSFVLISEYSFHTKTDLFE